MIHKLYFNIKKEDIDNDNETLTVIISGRINGKSVSMNVTSMQPGDSISFNYNTTETVGTNVNPGYLDDPIQIDTEDDTDGTAP